MDYLIGELKGINQMTAALILTGLLIVATYALISVNDTPEYRKQDDKAQMEWIKEYNNAH